MDQELLPQEPERALPQLQIEATSSSKVQPTNSEKNWSFRCHAITAGIILLVAVLLRFSSQEGGKSVAGVANLGDQHLVCSRCSPFVAYCLSKEVTRNIWSFDIS